MPITVEAVYENGTLRPTSPLPFNEHETVEITVHRKTSWVQETAGLIKWAGDHDTLRRLAEDVEFDPQESP